MKMSEFGYNLPKELIAQHPSSRRGFSNLLVLDRSKKKILDDKYFNIPKYVREGDIVVLNETEVMSCRTFFITPSGKKVEILFLEEIEKDTWFALIGRAKDVKIGDILVNEESNSFQIAVVERAQKGFKVIFKKGNANKLFEKYGHTPLPPYVKRKDTKEDKIRYNTVFSQKTGAVAAATASLNLTEDILKRIKSKGATVVKIELKIGWGTFQPVKEENIEEHRMHEEYFAIPKDSSSKINEAIRNGNRVWAFGTTVARALESSAYLDEKTGKYLVKAMKMKTDLYIYPGYEWKIVDVLVTNFHMPDSSLLLLVNSFAGNDNVKMAYSYAIDKEYKFLSYGDSMLIGDNLIE
ncbi:MAG: tRNA preQ1(34) S-adenosylmethionine ribosyltransferase-isomerase QueA [Candidatus Dojkabacteria bacterium]|jgi:S-adenosylmethionine:tRNA ribosyltransferase-isomerase